MSEKLNLTLRSTLSDVDLRPHFLIVGEFLLAAQRSPQPDQSHRLSPDAMDRLRQYNSRA